MKFFKVIFINGYQKTNNQKYRKNQKKIVEKNSTSKKKLFDSIFVFDWNFIAAFQVIGWQNFSIYSFWRKQPMPVSTILTIFFGYWFKYFRYLIYRLGASMKFFNVIFCQRLPKN